MSNWLIGELTSSGRRAWSFSGRLTILAPLTETILSIYQTSFGWQATCYVCVIASSFADAHPSRVACYRTVFFAIQGSLLKNCSWFLPPPIITISPLPLPAPEINSNQAAV